MLNKNYHTHLYLCNHATGDVFDYVKKAIDEKYEVIGISDHAPVMKEWFTDEEYKSLFLNENMKFDEFYDIYLKSIDEAILKYGDKIEILKGIESEYLPIYHEFYDELRYHLDYMILGMHYFLSDGKIIDTYKNINGHLAISYANEVKKALDTGLFNYLAHPDLYMIDYKSDKGDFVFDDDAKKAAEIILKACEDNDVLVEINCGGIRHTKLKKYKDEYLYPRTEFFELAKNYNVKFIIGCDAHSVDELANENVKKAIEFCKKLGLDAINIKQE